MKPPRNGVACAHDVRSPTSECVAAGSASTVRLVTKPGRAAWKLVSSHPSRVTGPIRFGGRTSGVPVRPQRSSPPISAHDSRVTAATGRACWPVRRLASAQQRGHRHTEHIELAARQRRFCSGGTSLIPLSRVHFGQDVEDAVLAVLRSGQIAQGPEVARFEEMVAAIAGTRHCIAVSNGTVALVAALRAAGIGPGDEVITSPFTFGATLNAVLAVGATARFADIDADDFLMSATSAANLVNSRTRAIVPVHIFGQMADMTAFSALATRYDLVLIEDAAQALGASQFDRSAGSFGLGCMSFYATKNVTTGEGGAVTTDDDMLAETLRLQRNQGMRSRYDQQMIGSNLRMTDLQAAIGLSQLRRISEITRRRQAHATVLDAALADVAAIQAPIVRAGNKHVFHQYTTRVLPEFGLTRDNVVRQLHDSGVESGVFYPRPVFDYDCYRHHPGVAADHCPVATDIAAQVVSLPVHHHLSTAEIDLVCSAVAGISA